MERWIFKNNFEWEKNEFMVEEEEKGGFSHKSLEYSDLENVSIKNFLLKTFVTRLDIIEILNY